LKDIGKKVVAVVSPVQNATGYVLVELMGGWMGALPIDTLMRQGVEEGGHKMRPGQVLQAVVVGGRPSELQSKRHTVALALDSPGYEQFFRQQDREKSALSKSQSSMVNGDVVQGTIKEIQASGALIELSASTMARFGSASPLAFLPLQEVGGAEDEERAKAILTLYMEESVNEDDDEEEENEGALLSFVVI
jgi:hypothetical protein